VSGQSFYPGEMEDARSNVVCFGDIVMIPLSQSSHSVEGYLAAEGLGKSHILVHASSRC